ncbi:MAG: type I glyceraldehyde-3-phosphate dehydrogenase [Candidatus Shikimatogenerans bostrichidophilus]|nr:MAG: type I glyceraldehyde-3-phosphate dehydrogenase [Candidatus Shikimatogenerans bostrichidophilus]
MIKIGINGFNRISKIILYYAIKRKNIEIVSININNFDNIDIDKIIYMIKYDSLYNKEFNKLNIIKYKNNIIINNKNFIKITNIKNIKDLKWKKLKAKYIIETNNKNKYLYKKNLLNHIKVGAKKVILTNYSKDKKIPIFIIGVNHKLIKKKHNIFSISTSTINCLAPILKILHRELKIKELLITNINSLNNDKNILKLDKYYNNYFYRSSLYNIIPNINNYLNKDIIKIIPELKNKINNISFIVPILGVSLVDLNIKIKKNISFDNLKKIFKFYSKNEFSGILGYNNKELVSIDFLYNKNLSIFDSKLSLMLNKKFFKIISWYNNEIAYSNKLLDLIEYIEYNL